MVPEKWSHSTFLVISPDSGLQLPSNPNGRLNADVMKPWANGMEIMRRPQDTWIIDFGAYMSEAEAALYEAPFEHVRNHVKPIRDIARRDAHRRAWWRLW